LVGRSVFDGEMAESDEALRYVLESSTGYNTFSFWIISFFEAMALVYHCSL